MAKRRPAGDGLVRKRSDGRWEILTEEQLEKFLTVVNEDPWWRDFFYTELTTGMRRGEICGLKWRDFDEKTGRLTIRRSVTKRDGGGIKVGETKTETGMRTIQLPPSTAELLRQRKKKSYSDWIFHNPTVAELPLSPQTACNHMKTLLHRADLPLIRFRDLRHTFATHALSGGVDAKTPASILGHTNASFTLDIYSHVTDTMQQQAAARIDRQIGGLDTPIPEAETPPVTPRQHFQPTPPNRRKSSTGGIYQLNDHLWEGKFSPTDAHGKRISRNVYAQTREECEAKLAVLIEEMKAEIAAEKAALIKQEK